MISESKLHFSVSHIISVREHEATCAVLPIFRPEPPPFLCCELSSILEIFLRDCNILLLLFGIIALLTSLTLSQWKCYNRTWSIFMKPWWLASYSTYLLSRKSRYFPIRDGANKNFFFLSSCMHHICQPAKFKLTSTSVQTWTLDMKCHNIYILVSQTHNSSCYLELFSSSIVASLCKKLH